MAETPFTSLDFDQVKTNLKNYLKDQSQFKDVDFDGSNINTLLDVMAYNAYQKAHYDNMVFSEMFLETAQMKENVASRAKPLGYTPSSTQSASALVDIQVFPTAALGESLPPFVQMPKGAKFSAVCGNTTFTFVTDADVNIFPQDGEYIARDVPVYEGREVKEFYTVDGSEDQRFLINNENVDTRSIIVKVRDNNDPNSSVTEFTYSDTIFGITTDDPVFFVESYFDDLYQITFGRNKFGRQPSSGNVIEIDYRISKGDAANGASGFNPVSNISGFSSDVINVPVAGAGSNPEDIESIRYLAPKALQVQDRAVTKSDYEILLRQRFPNIQAISVYGGDELNPPQYGKVYISVDVIGGLGAGSSEIALFREYISGKSPLTIEPVFVPAQFLYVDLNIVVNYNTRLTTKSPIELSNIVKNRILNYSESNLNKFNTYLRQSRLSNLIDTTDVSVISTDITAKPIIDYVPEIGITSNPIFEFNDSLVRPYAFNESLGFDNYVPAISTTAFTLNGIEVYLQDDGLGNMIAVTSGISNRRVFKKNIGTVDYEKGTVRMSNFLVQAYQGAAIKFIANTTNKDVYSSKDRILVLRNEDINIDVRAQR